MKEIILGLGVVLAIVLGLLGINPDVQSIVDNRVKEVASSFGALSGPDIASPYLKWGDVPVNHAGSPLNTANHIACALQSPAATSTLVAAGIRADTGTTTALTNIYLAKAATATATTTSLGIGSADANNQFTVIASTTPTNADAVIFAPNQYFVVNLRGGAGNTFPQYSPTGSCWAEWVTSPSF